MSIIRVLEEVYGVPLNDGAEVEANLEASPEGSGLTLKVAYLSGGPPLSADKGNISAFGGVKGRMKWANYVLDQTTVFPVVCAFVRQTPPHVYERANDD
jgi:hypothetical protein